MQLKQVVNKNSKGDKKYMPKHCEYMQQIKHLKFSMEEIKKTIKEHSTIKYWAYIIHDKDLDKEGNKIEPHIHLYLNFGKSTVKFEDVAKWFKDEPQFVGRVKGKRSDMLKYLTHQNAPEKHQYDANEIRSNFDITTAIIEEEKTDIDFILRKISDGTIREYNRFEYIDEVVLIRNSNLINTAFKHRSEKIMRNPNRNIKVIMIYGTTGSGKTTYAKMLASKIGDGSYYVSSSSNDSMQDYKGQETVIFDDLRDDVFEFADILKVLDNYTATSIRSRFYNKTFLGSTIIITTTVPILEWYHYSKEDKAQLRRRISNYLIIEDKTISFYNFNPDNNYLPNYQYTIKNPVSTILAEQTKDQQKLDNILDICKCIVNDITENNKQEFIDDIYTASKN